jgi:tetratricopeptide (TPR) repeat protein
MTRAAELARALVDAGTPAWPSDADVAPEALAWALKDEAVAAWGTQPGRALHCAAVLRALPPDRRSPDTAAASAWTEGLAALSEGRMADAEVCFSTAHAALQALGRDHEAARTQVNRMIVLAMLGRDEEARACGEQTLAAFAALGDEREAGKVELNLGTMQARADRHTQAAELFRSAAVRAARAGDRELSIRADIALANALTWLHDWDEALRVLARARMRAETHGHTVLQAHAHAAIGRLALNRGDAAQALRELAAACSRLEAADASPQQRIEAEAALADAYLAVDLLPESIALYERVIAEAHRLDAPNEEAWALLQRGRAQARAGDTDAARAALGAAHALYQRQANAAALAWTELATAALDLAAGQLDAAVARADAAAQALQQARMPGWQREAELLRADIDLAAGRLDAAGARLQSLQGVADAGSELACALSHRIGLLAWQRGDADAAQTAFDRALQQIDERRAALPGDLFRHGSGAPAEAVHQCLVQIGLERREPAIRLLERIEQGRAQALSWALAEGPGLQEGVRPETDIELQHARDAWQWSRERWRQAVAEGDGDASAALEAEVAQGEARWLEALRRARLAQPAVPAGARRATPTRPDIAALGASLQPDQAVVVYHRHGTQLLVGVVTSDGTELAEVAADGLDTRLRGLRGQIDAMRGRGGLQPHAELLLQRARSHAQALHTMVWAPIQHRLAGRRRIVVVPHRDLHYLPFAALHDGQAWLVQRYVISLAPGAGWAPEALAAPRPRPTRALAVGIDAGGLQHAAHEAAAVAQAVGTHAQLLVGPAATQAALRAAAPGLDLLHIATHGHFRADNPMFSALSLADGPLTLHDAAGLGLQGCLVTLSACETGLSRSAPGNETIGLVRGFLLAGAPAVMASQWAVDDAATAGLMHDIYRTWLAGAGPAAALAAAQARRAAAGEHPFFWAAFALHGQGSGDCGDHADVFPGRAVAR